MARYRILSNLGVGRRGPVYRALDQQTGLEVALRTFAPSARTRPLPPPEHPALARVLQVGRMRGAPYAVVELLEGPTLSAQPVDPRVFLVAALSGVAAAHGAGVTHGAMRPHNVYLEKGRGVVIADFGLPEAHEEARLAAPVHSFLAPEQVSDPRCASPAADVYALGAIAYRLLAGRAPFEEGPALAPSILRLPPAPPPGPPDLVNLVLRMLQKDARLRPTSGSALAQLAAERLPPESTTP